MRPFCCVCPSGWCWWTHAGVCLLQEESGSGLFASGESASALHVNATLPKPWRHNPFYPIIWLTRSNLCFNAREIESAHFGPGTEWVSGSDALIIRASAWRLDDNAVMTSHRAYQNAAGCGLTDRTLTNIIVFLKMETYQNTLTNLFSFYIYICHWYEIHTQCRLLTNYSPLLIPNYMAQCS